ncbi:MAG TPA: type II secretion system protein GspN [Myxococcota bacterium]|jgi:type II secretion system protein N|nr:type II secretion system protein GspN [Myxococcota bacterium]
MQLPALPKAATLVRFAGYPAFFLAALIIFGYVTFPFDRLALNIITQVEANLGVDVELEGFEPSWGTGVHIDKLSVTMPSRNKDDPPQTYVVTNVNARAGLFALLGRSLSVSLDAELAGGEIEAHYAEDTGGVKLSIEASGVRLDDFAALQALTGVPVKGGVVAKLDVELPEKKLKNAKGRLEMTIVEGMVGDKGAHIKAGLTGSLAYLASEGIEMEKGLSLGRFSAVFDIKDGRATAEEFEAAGGDAEGSYAGFIMLRDRLGSSTLAGYVKFKVSEDYLKESRKFTMLMGSPSLTRATRSDGYYGFNVRGTLSNPQFLPAKTEGAGAGAAARRPGAGPKGPRPGISVTPGMDGAEPGEPVMGRPPVARPGMGVGAGAAGAGLEVGAGGVPGPGAGMAGALEGAGAPPGPGAGKFGASVADDGSGSTGSVGYVKGSGPPSPGMGAHTAAPTGDLSVPVVIPAAPSGGSDDDDDSDGDGGT